MVVLPVHVRTRGFNARISGKPTTTPVSVTATGGRPGADRPPASRRRQGLGPTVRHVVVERATAQRRELEVDPLGELVQPDVLVRHNAPARTASEAGPMRAGRARQRPA